MRETSAVHVPADEKLRKITKAIYHSGYREDIDRDSVGEQIRRGTRRGDDLAIVEISSPAPDGYEPVVWANNLELTQGTNLLLAGYGLTKLIQCLCFSANSLNLIHSLVSL